MGIRCLLGHDATQGVYNAGVVVGQCWRCQREVIRAPGGRWYALPRGVGVNWAAGVANPLSAREVLAEARRQAPLLHRLRRRRKAWERYYL